MEAAENLPDTLRAMQPARAGPAFELRPASLLFPAEGGEEVCPVLLAGASCDHVNWPDRLDLEYKSKGSTVSTNTIFLG